MEWAVGLSYFKQKKESKRVIQEVSSKLLS